ncbi:MAG TPA: rhodanese-like domain-containing protein [Terriglobales bacterium]|nr:rhodanese-like domain-containing protein [Terriglobales bacterium]
MSDQTAVKRSWLSISPSLLLQIRHGGRLWSNRLSKGTEHPCIAEAKRNIIAISLQDAAAKSQSGEAVIVDVRGKDEWDKEQIRNATHLSRGTIELDIEKRSPDKDTMIICHCGGGGRSASAVENPQGMGYKNVRSMAGGFKAWKAAGLPMTK